MIVPDPFSLVQGDNLEVLKSFPNEFVDLVYIDPPFFTNKQQSNFDRTLYQVEGKELVFQDVWASAKEYLDWVRPRLQEIHRVLRPSGSVFFHCDWHASHLLRVLLDETFHADQFRSEIIWYYKRWSNSLKGFQRAHQTIHFYSKSDGFKFYPLHEEYSLTTNIDQIWQKRGRDAYGKCVTLTHSDGAYQPHDKDKAGVPMRDVWEIPYLNPRAKERTGWPTQKPLELLRRIVLATTEAGDVVLDPACGSGTALVAAKELNRAWIGIDCSEEALEITRRRLVAVSNVTEGNNHHQPYLLSRFLKLSETEKRLHIGRLLEMNIVHRNRNLDGILKKSWNGSNVAVRYIGTEENAEAISGFVHTAAIRNCRIGIAVTSCMTKQEKEALQAKFSGPVALFVLSYNDISKKGFSLERVLSGRPTASLFE